MHLSTYSENFGALHITTILKNSGFSVEQTAKLAGLAIEKVAALAE
jgi:hypothetical protein